jgi:hypothetical protein
MNRIRPAFFSVLLRIIKGVWYIFSQKLGTAAYLDSPYQINEIQNQFSKTTLSQQKPLLARQAKSRKGNNRV